MFDQAQHQKHRCFVYADWQQQQPTNKIGIVRDQEVACDIFSSHHLESHHEFIAFSHWSSDRIEQYQRIESNKMTPHKHIRRFPNSSNEHLCKLKSDEFIKWKIESS